MMLNDDVILITLLLCREMNTIKRRRVIKLIIIMLRKHLIRYMTINYYHQASGRSVVYDTL
jgi:hypothetical protein